MWAIFRQLGVRELLDAVVPNSGTWAHMEGDDWGSFVAWGGSVVTSTHRRCVREGPVSAVHLAEAHLIRRGTHRRCVRSPGWISFVYEGTARRRWRECTKLRWIIGGWDVSNEQHNTQSIGCRRRWASVSFCPTGNNLFSLEQNLHYTKWCSLKLHWW